MHKPAMLCPECDGFCLRRATIDEANTALCVAVGFNERLAAVEALADAAKAEASRLRKAILATRRSKHAQA